jgi:hypothetical protein
MSEWKMLFENEERRVWIYEDEQKTLIKTEHFVQPCLDRNAELRAANAGKRWGEGQIVSSIPTGLYFADLVEARKNRDTKYVKRFLNDPDHRKFRVFEGTV